MISLRLVVSLALLVGGCRAFVPVSTPTSRSALLMATSTKGKVSPPTFDKKTQRWTPATLEESAAGGYDEIGTLLRQGPKAYFTRVTNQDQYDQAVLKFMAQERCSYQMAQGNLDRMNENMQDWMFERMEAEKAGRKINYVRLDRKQIVLTLVWSAGIFFLIGRALYVAVTGDSFNDIFR